MTTPYRRKPSTPQEHADFDRQQREHHERQALEVEELHREIERLQAVNNQLRQQLAETQDLLWDDPARWTVAEGGG